MTWSPSGSLTACGSLASRTGRRLVARNRAAANSVTRSRIGGPPTAPLARQGFVGQCRQVEWMAGRTARRPTARQRGRIASILGLQEGVLVNERGDPRQGRGRRIHALALGQPPSGSPCRGYLLLSLPSMRGLEPGRRRGHSTPTRADGAGLHVPGGRASAATLPQAPLAAKAPVARGWVWYARQGSNL